MHPSGTVHALSTPAEDVTAPPFGLGDTTVEQMTLGYELTGGLSFPWTGGGTLLMRRRLYPTTGAWAYCGFAKAGEVTISQMAGLTHEADEGYQYVAVGVVGNGFISRLCEPVRVDFDGLADLITPALPLFPQNLLEPLASSRPRSSVHPPAF